jgi:hypothetical protein
LCLVPGFRLNDRYSIVTPHLPSSRPVRNVRPGSSVLHRCAFAFGGKLAAPSYARESALAWSPTDLYGGAGESGLLAGERKSPPAASVVSGKRSTRPLPRVNSSGNAVSPPHAQATDASPGGDGDSAVDEDDDSETRAGREARWRISTTEICHASPFPDNRRVPLLRPTREAFFPSF